MLQTISRELRQREIPYVVIVLLEFFLSFWVHSQSKTDRSLGTLFRIDRTQNRTRNILVREHFDGNAENMRAFRR